MKGDGMIDDHLGESEAEELGARLEALCQELSPRQQEFLRAALRLAAADLWARTSEPTQENSIQHLIVDIQQAGAARAISLNPLPIPPNPKGQIV
jgi:methionyl-tRNA synthetase